MRLDIVGIHSRSAICCCWDRSGSNIFSGGCDNQINVWNIGKPCSVNSFNKLGEHKSTVNCLEYNKNYNLLISGSWDKRIKYWDIRCNKSCFVGCTKLDLKIYTMSTAGNTLIIGLSSSSIRYCDLRMINGGKTLYFRITHKLL